MANHDFQVQISKDGILNVVNPSNGSSLANLPFNGQIMKGCSGGGTVQIMTQTATGPRAVNVTSFNTLFSFGIFSSPSAPGVLSMEQNPKFSDSGYEVEETPGQAFPKLQFWKMFGIFTIDLSGLNPGLRKFQVANREEDPIRLSCRLSRPWGEEALQYILMDDRIPLYPWDSATFDFATVCPLTGGQPSTIAFIEKKGDKTHMTAAWRRINGILTKTL